MVGPRLSIMAGLFIGYVVSGAHLLFRYVVGKSYDGISLSGRYDNRSGRAGVDEISGHDQDAVEDHWAVGLERLTSPPPQ